MISAIVVGIFVAVAGCVELPEKMEPGDDCPDDCPAGMVAVDRCPAFTQCQEYPGCEDPAICAPEEAVNDENDERRPPGEVDCDQPVECPAGSVEVDECEPGDVCTRVTVCDADKLCKEDAAYCAEVPKCSDDNRAVDHCEGLDEEYCGLEHHCSGPVYCLECYDELPDECPEGTQPVDESEECDDETVVCEQVETCEETLTCASECIEDPECPGELEEVDECGDDEEGPECMELPGCDGVVSCAAAEEDCDEVPECEDGYEEVEVDQCWEGECEWVVKCGAFVACQGE